MNQIAPRTAVKPFKGRPNFELMRLRLNAGLSPNDLGRLAGCSGRSIRDAEAGRTPHPRTQRQIADVLEVAVLEIWPLARQSRSRAGAR